MKLLGSSWSQNPSYALKQNEKEAVEARIIISNVKVKIDELTCVIEESRR